MTAGVSAADIALRLFLTALAALLVGFDRTARGRAAGVRTTLLVALAACLAMIEASQLLLTAGKTPQSFATVDTMRLPLGILTGVGFIGAGAILKREDGVVGLTTAATLWFITVIGLCLGAGQIGLGSVGALCGFAVLRGLKLVESRMMQDRLCRFDVEWDAAAFDAETALEGLRAAGLRLTGYEGRSDLASGRRALSCEVRRHALPAQLEPPHELEVWLRRPGVLRWEWKDATFKP